MIAGWCTYPNRSLWRLQVKLRVQYKHNVWLGRGGCGGCVGREGCGFLVEHGWRRCSGGDIEMSTRGDHVGCPKGDLRLGRGHRLRLGLPRWQRHW